MTERTFAYRGVIEGFYGPPWSHENRLHLLRHMPTWNMNLYICSARNDPYHRFHWDVPYPAAWEITWPIRAITIHRHHSADT